MENKQVAGGDLEDSTPMLLNNNAFILLIHLFNALLASFVGASTKSCHKYI